MKRAAPELQLRPLASACCSPPTRTDTSPNGHPITSDDSEGPAKSVLLCSTPGSRSPTAVTPSCRVSERIRTRLRSRHRGQGHGSSVDAIDRLGRRRRSCARWVFEVDGRGARRLPGSQKSRSCAVGQVAQAIDPIPPPHRFGVAVTATDGRAGPPVSSRAIREA